MMKTICLVGMAVLLPSLVASCNTDAKGASCTDSLLYTNDKGDSYCKDDGAPADCETFDETFFARAASCTGVPEADLRADAPVLKCENAVATTADFDACIAGLKADTFCKDNGIVAVDACNGAIITSE
jgi:hypothetical protein